MASSSPCFSLLNVKDDAAVSEYPPPLKQKSLIGEDNHVKLSQSPSDDRYSESSEDGVHVKGYSIALLLDVILA